MKTRIVLLICLIGLLFQAECGLFKKEDSFDLEKILKSRPSEKRCVFDYCHLIKYGKENKEGHLGFLKRRYGVEMLIVTIPSLQNKKITQVASEMFTNWDIGRETGGKGLLLLLSEKEKLIKVEVGYGAEGVFTDLFCGYIEKMQLKPHFEYNQVDSGLTATLEEFLGRADGKLTDERLRKKIEAAEKYLSGGGGIKKKVEIGKIRKREKLSEEERKRFSAQPTPEDLFMLVMETQERNINDPSLDIYTEETKVLLQYQAPGSKERGEVTYRQYTKSHEIKQQGDYAVVLYFQKKKTGPLFFKKTAKGWQFDMVSTSKWVIYTSTNDWFLGGNKHPWMFAFRDNQYSQFVRDLHYHDDYGKFSGIESNYEYYINQYEEKLKQDPGDLETIISLAEIFFDLTIMRKAAPLLEKAIEINPKDPRAYRYLGLLTRDYFKSEKEALRYLEKFMELAPSNPRGYVYVSTAHYQLAAFDNNPYHYGKAAEFLIKFAELSGEWLGHCDYIAYYYYCKKDYSQAKKWYKKSLELDKTNAYAARMLQKIENLETQR